MNAPRTSRRECLRTAGGLALAGLTGLAGCTGNATGTLATRVSDQPGDIDDFASCVVTVAGIWVEPDGSDGTATATATVDDGDGREYHAFEAPRTADLVALRGDRTALLGEHELEVGEYAFLQLDVTGVDATLPDGGEATVDTPGNAPLQFKHRFEVRADTRTTFTADFTPVRRGGTGTYLLKPVARDTSVSYEPTAGTTT